MMTMRENPSGPNVLLAGTILALVWVSLGCGGSGKNGEPGDGAVSGMVQGRAFTGKGGAFDEMADLSLLIAVPESDGICQLATSGTPPARDLVWLSMYVCTDSAGAVGEYQVQAGGGGQSPCPGRVAWAELRRFLGGTPSLIAVDSGTITIQTRTGQELAGTAALTIGSESLSGSFSARFCPDLNRP